VYDWQNDLHLLRQSGCFIGIKLGQSVINAGVSVLELSTGNFYS
jgi:hypothetical protein